MIGAAAAARSRAASSSRVHAPAARDGALYTLDPDPNDIYGYWCAMVTGGFGPDATRRAATRSTTARPTPPRPRVGVARGSGGRAQARFLAGLDALHRGRRAARLRGEQARLHRRAGRRADPAGAGTARHRQELLHGLCHVRPPAGRDGRGPPLRVFVSCKTHAATDVLLENVLACSAACCAAQRGAARTIAARYLDPRLLDVPLFRVRPRDAGAGRRGRARRAKERARPAQRRRDDPGGAVVRRRRRAGRGQAALSRDAGATTSSATTSATCSCSTKPAR